MARSVAVKWKINGHDKRHKNYIINSKNFIDKKIYDGKKGISKVPLHHHHSPQTSCNDSF
jgi:hypothetical protein